MVMANLGVITFSVLVCAVSPRCLCAPPPLHVWPLLVASVVLCSLPRPCSAWMGFPCCTAARPGWASLLGPDGSLPCRVWGLLWSDTTWRDAWCDVAVQGKGASRYHRP